MVTGSQESVRSGVRPRLQRQMAQSRKTFRFRKSKHGHAEVCCSLNYSHDLEWKDVVIMLYVLFFLKVLYSFWCLLSVYSVVLLYIISFLSANCMNLKFCKDDSVDEALCDYLFVYYG